MLDHANLDNAGKVYQTALLISHLRHIKTDAHTEALDDATAGDWLTDPGNTALINARVTAATVDANLLTVLEDFAGAANGNIADADHRTAKAANLEEMTIIQIVSQAHRSAEDGGKGLHGLMESFWSSGRRASSVFCVAPA